MTVSSLSIHSQVRAKANSGFAGKVGTVQRISNGMVIVTIDGIGVPFSPSELRNV